MAAAFNLTAQLNLQGPSNVGAIVTSIQKQLNNVSANVNVKINPATSQNIATLNAAFANFNTTLAITSTNSTNAANAIRGLTTAIGQANNPLNNLQQNMTNNATAAAQLTQNLQNLNRVQNRCANDMEELGRQAAGTIRRFAAFGVVTGGIYKLGNAINSAAKEFLDFNKELVRVAQVTDTSLSNLASLTAQISQLSTTFGVASSDLIKVSSTLAQAGLSAKDTEKALKALALSALAPSFDSLNDTVEGSIALMRQFDISAGDLEGALGSVNAVAAKFAVEASDIITAIQRTGGVFATASRGVATGTEALNQFIAVFTSIRATTRESAETISTGLRTIFTRIQRKDTIDALRQFGVILTDLEGKFIGPYAAVERLSEGLSKLDPRDLRFSQIVEELGGFRQIGKVIPLIQQFATAQDALKVAQKGQASLAYDAAIAQESVANKITKVREEFIGLIRSIGDSQSFQTFIKLSLDLTSQLIRLADAAKNVLPAVLAIAAIRSGPAALSFGRGFVGGLRRSQGGPIGFASGGYVPGQGDGDTVPAMLTPGEFVIRKKAVQAIGADRLAGMNKYASGGLVLKQTQSDRYAGLFAKPKANDSSGKPVSIPLVSRGIEGQEVLAAVGSPKSYFIGRTDESTFEADAESRLLSAIELISDNLGGPKIPSTALKSQLTQSIGVKDIAGKIFEGVSRTIAGSFGGGAQSSFDIARGTVNNTEALYEMFNAGQPMPDIDYDAKLSENRDNRASLLKKAINQNLLGPDISLVNFQKKLSTDELLRLPKGDDRNKSLIQRRSELETAKQNAANILNDPDVEKLVISRIQSQIKMVGSAIPAGARAAMPKTPKGKNSGGLISFFANGGSPEDTVPALLTPGEFVINKRAASRIGLSTLHKMNHADKVQGFAKGGAVQTFATGGPASTTNPWSGITGTLGSAAQNTATSFQALTKASNSAAQSFKGFGPKTSGFRGLLASLGLTGVARNIPKMTSAGGMLAAFAGQTAITNASEYMGGEKTTSGRMISNIGGDMLTYGALGASVGGPWGGLAGAALGLVTGFQKAQKAGLEYAHQTTMAANDMAAQRAATALEDYRKDPTQSNKEYLSTLLSEAAMRAAGAKETLANKTEFSTTGMSRLGDKLTDLSKMTGIGRETTRQWERQGQDVKQVEMEQYAKEKAKAYETAAKTYMDYIALEMEKTGKTFEQVTAAMSPEQFNTFTNTILQANVSYNQMLIQHQRFLDTMREEGASEERLTEASKQLEEARMNAAVQVMQDAASAPNNRQKAKNSAEAQRKAAILLERSVIGLEKAFDIISQTLKASSFRYENTSNRAEEIFSGKPNLKDRGAERRINIMQNPLAYSEFTRNQAVEQSSEKLGAYGPVIANAAKFGDSIESIANKAKKAAQENMGADTEDPVATVSDSIKRSIVDSITKTFGGADNSIARSLINSMDATLADVVSKAKDAGGNVDWNKVIEEITGPLSKLGEESRKILIEAEQNYIDGINRLTKINEMITEVESRRQKRINQFTDLQKENQFRRRESLGGEVSYKERATARSEAIMRRVGVAANPKDMFNQILSLNAKIEKTKIERQEALDKGDVESVNILEKQMLSLSNRVKDTRQELENLPESIQANLNDVFEEMQKRTRILTQVKETAAGFAEKIVTGTPDDIIEMNIAFGTMSRAINGFDVSIRNSISANKAYFKTLREGGTVQEAVISAQQAYANENKNALQMFDEIAKFAGLEGRDIDLQRANLLEGFAKSQGFQNNPMIIAALARLREDPTTRKDPVLDRLKAEADVLKKMQENTINQLSALETQTVKLLDAEGSRLVELINDTKMQVEIQLKVIANELGLEDIFPKAPLPPEQPLPAGVMAAKGGLIYASKGQLINFKPRGTDTVPAMLTPGEFVVNAESTSKNLGLLHSINRSKGGNVNYLKDGGVAGSDQQVSRPKPAKFTDKSGKFSVMASIEEPVDNLLSYVVLRRADNNTVIKVPWKKLSYESRALATEQSKILNAYKYQNTRDIGRRSVGVSRLVTEDKAVEYEKRGNGEFMGYGGSFAMIDTNAMNKRRETVPRFFQARNVTGKRYGTDAERGGMFASVDKVDFDAETIKVQKYNSLAEKTKTATYAWNKFSPQSLQDAITDYGFAHVSDIPDELFFPKSKLSGEFPNIVFGKGYKEKYPELYNNAVTAKAPSGEETKTNLVRLFYYWIKRKELKYNRNYTETDQEMKEIEIAEMEAKNKARYNSKKQESAQNKAGGGLIYMAGGGKVPGQQKLTYQQILDQRKQAYDMEMQRRRQSGGIRTTTKIGANGLPVTSTGRGEVRMKSGQSVSDFAEQRFESQEKIKSQQDYRKGVEERVKEYYTDFYGSTIKMGLLNEGFVIRNSQDFQRALDEAKKNPNGRTLIEKGWVPPDYTDNKSAVQALIELGNRLKAEFRIEAKMASDPRFVAELDRISQLRQNRKTFEETRKAKAKEDRAPQEERRIQEARKMREAEKRAKDKRIKRELEERANASKSMSTGGVVYASEGRLINFRPKGTDTVPAMLSPGEFVVNRDATQKNLGLLKQINKGYSRGGAVQYYQNGGVAGNSSSNGVIDVLGGRLDNFIQQLSQAIPSTVRLEVPQPIPVNVVINGAGILQNVLGGPLGELIATQIREAFARQSRATEGAVGE